MPNFYNDYMVNNRNRDSREELSPVIYRYHSENRPSVYFNGGEDNGNNLFLGIELEFDTRDTHIGNRNNKLDTIAKSNEIFGNRTFAYYMNDGSLSHGLEMITQPATWDYHNSISDKYSKLFDMITEHGFKSQSYQSCGLHIHFNRSYFNDGNEDLYTMNLLYLVEKFWRDLVLLSRRDYSRLQRWADKYYEKPDEVVKRYKDVYGYGKSRYRAVNLCNSNTIEFRIYRGTLDINDFMATLELTKNLIVAAKTKTVNELQDMKFDELLTSRNLLKYSNKCHRKNAINRLPNELKNV